MITSQSYDFIKRKLLLGIPQRLNHDFNNRMLLPGIPRRLSHATLTTEGSFQTFHEGSLNYVITSQSYDFIKRKLLLGIPQRFNHDFNNRMLLPGIPRRLSHATLTTEGSFQTFHQGSIRFDSTLFTRYGVIAVILGIPHILELALTSALFPRYDVIVVTWLRSIYHMTVTSSTTKM